MRGPHGKGNKAQVVPPFWGRRRPERPALAPRHDLNRLEDGHVFLSHGPSLRQGPLAHPEAPGRGGEGTVPPVSHPAAQLRAAHLLAGMDMRTLQEMLGHASIMTTGSTPISTAKMRMGTTTFTPGRESFAFTVDFQAGR